MRQIRVSVASLMVLVALVAMDMIVLQALRTVPGLHSRIGLFGSLPLANVLVVCLAVAASSLTRRGEVSVSLVTFILFGGAAILLLLAVVELWPPLFYMYISNTAGLWVRSGQNIAAVYSFALGGIRLIEAFLVFGVVTLPALAVALLAGRVTRGYRLKLIKVSDSDATPPAVH